MKKELDKKQYFLLALIVAILVATVAGALFLSSPKNETPSQDGFPPVDAQVSAELTEVAHESLETLLKTSTVNLKELDVASKTWGDPLLEEKAKSEDFLTPANAYKKWQKDRLTTMSRAYIAEGLDNIQQGWADMVSIPEKIEVEQVAQINSRLSVRRESLPTYEVKTKVSGTFFELGFGSEAAWDGTVEGTRGKYQGEATVTIYRLPSGEWKVDRIEATKPLKFLLNPSTVMQFDSTSEEKFEFKIRKTW